jgi:hypothetical protein
LCKETRESFLLITSEHCKLYICTVCLSVSPPPPTISECLICTDLLCCWVCNYQYTRIF